MRAEDSWFERGVSDFYPEVGRRLSRSGEHFGLWYSVDVPLGRFEQRRVEVLVPFDPAFDPYVYVDGPTTSPHRYFVPGRGFVRLCLWYPEDPRELRWHPDDGLLALLGHVRTHLIREGYYREDLAEHGKAKWLGPEAPHGRQPPARRKRCL